MGKTRIVIGICTYKRPEMLKKALVSIGDMEKPMECLFYIIVVDNDPSGSAKGIVEDIRSRIQIPVYSFVEKVRGLPVARNRILYEAKTFGPDHIAFVDDDEFVDRYWFVNLWAFYKYSKGDVALVFIKKKYPAHTPDWIIKNNFCQRYKISNRMESTLLQAVKAVFRGDNWDFRSKYDTGEIIQSGSIGNCIVNYKKIVLEKGLRFDEKIGLMGGSDADFFDRARAKGVIIQWVDNAVVFEVLDDNKMALLSFLKGIFRTRNYKHEKKSSFPERLKLVVRGSVIGFSGFLSIPVNIFRGKCYFSQTLKALTISGALFLSAFNIFIKLDKYK